MLQWRLFVSSATVTPATCATDTSTPQAVRVGGDECYDWCFCVLAPPLLNCMLVDRGQKLQTEWGTVVCEDDRPLLIKIPIFKEPTTRLEDYLKQNIIADQRVGGIFTKHGRIIFDKDGGNNTLTFRLHYY